LKIKRLPEDFQVAELSDFPATGGEFSLYRLSKRSLGTPEAIDEIIRRWHVPRPRVSYGGLKDRHAITQQYLTVRNGPRRNLSEKNLELCYLGQCGRPFTPRDIAGNRFTIVIRDLSQNGLAAALDGLAEAARDGLPNYFDDQRFGSVGESGEFIARAWCRGDFERALWLALADPHRDDRPDEREQKQRLRAHWGRWPECKAALDRSHRRSVITYLADKPPDRPDYRGAFARLKVDLRGLYLAAFQSFLWNRMLVRFLGATVSAERFGDISLKLDTVRFFTALDDHERKLLHETELPLPSARLHLDEGPTLDLVRDVLTEVGLELRELRVKYPRDSFFFEGKPQGRDPRRERSARRRGRRPLCEAP
jgi:tRNA pseudouridine13 synthase